ncbi:MAG: hypothetical protein ACJA13_000576 [Paraglaciecola sp.]|jgi:hypothetical protein
MSAHYSAPAAHFNIKVVGRLITVTLRGVWTNSLDLIYLSELGETMGKMRGNPWAVLVDMRAWEVPKSVSNSPIKPRITLDRRNQKLEYWLVDHSAQGDDLLPYFLQSGLMPQRFLTASAVYQSLLDTGYVLAGTELEEIVSGAPNGASPIVNSPT